MTSECIIIERAAHLFCKIDLATIKCVGLHPFHLHSTTVYIVPEWQRWSSKRAAIGAVELPCLNFDVAQAILMHCS
jgi:hypothetical protein